MGRSVRPSVEQGLTSLLCAPGIADEQGICRSMEEGEALALGFQPSPIGQWPAVVTRTGLGGLGFSMAEEHQFAHLKFSLATN